jgi:cytoskeletal protein RodZ
VTVGEAIAQARGAAGLSVDEVSERTGIRETVIRDIERDDFAALGGDLYVRGYLRAIAAAVGLDPQPLIREFDAARSLSAARPAIAAPALATTGTAEAGQDYSSLWWADDAVSDADPAPAPATTLPATTLPATTLPATTLPATQHAHTAQHARHRSRVRGWRWATTISVFTIVVLGIVGVATVQIVTKLRSPGHASAAATPTVRPAVAKNSPAPSSPAAATPTAPATKPAAVTPTPKATPTPARKATPKPPPAVRLAVQEASAFGPDGVADGDNPRGAPHVISPGSPLPWQTDWYTTASFGMLKDGTGLLLDMGRTVTVTSVQIRLGSIGGADLQVRAGDAASLGAAPVLASAQDAGGALTLRLKAPARARYVIIWFTGLPPSGAGKYQATVYSVAVTGRP